MNVRNLSELTLIMGFNGEYAVYKAKDAEGTYQGLVNRHGEIVWGDKLVHPINRLRSYPSIYSSIKRGESGFVYFDADQRKYIDRPELQPRQLSRAEQIAEDSPWIDFVDSEGRQGCYHQLCWVTDELLSFADGREKRGICDLEQNVILPAVYKYIVSGGPNLLAACIDDKWGVIDLKGNWFIPREYDFIYRQDDFYVARKNDKVGILDANGKVIIPLEYEALCPARQEGLDLISAKKDGEIFFINGKQERIELF